MNYKKQKNPLTQQIGKKISEIRRTLKISQAELETKTDINGESKIKHRTLSLIEQGYGEPKITTLYEIATALCVPLADLVQLGSLKTHSISQPKQNLLNEIGYLLNTFDEKKLKIALQQLKALKNLD